jgi:hypothetical protein
MSKNSISREASGLPDEEVLVNPSYESGSADPFESGSNEDPIQDDSG